MLYPNSQANQVVKSCMQPAYITFFLFFSILPCHNIIADRQRKNRITEEQVQMVHNRKKAEKSSMYTLVSM